MHNRTQRVYLWLVILFCTFKHIQAEQLATTKQEELWITIFVHGIISVKPFLSPYNIYILMQDDIHGSVYAHTINHARVDPYFHNYHAMQEIGLKKVDMETIEKGNGASAFARSYDYLHEHARPDQNTYYTYGWSALLSKKIWAREAEKFYETLCKEINTYRAQGMNPKIRIVGYSHGGTIAMHLAHAHQNSSQETSLCIDELIVIGMPGVPEARELIHSPLFKKIYHIYSHGDRVQTLDFFSLNVLFSKRTYLGCKSNPLPDNFYQIGIKLYRLSKPCTKKCAHGHLFPAPPRHLRPAHPGHSELWSFGWAGGYRESFPLYPLPVGCLIPWFVDVSEQFKDQSHHISIAMHHYSEHAQVYCHTQKTTHDVQGIKNDIIAHMKDDAWLFYPQNAGQKCYEDHLKKAIRKAHETVRMTT